jgi:hypothetical protein
MRNSSVVKSSCKMKLLPSVAFGLSLLLFTVKAESQKGHYNVSVEGSYTQEVYNDKDSLVIDPSSNSGN